MTCHAAVPIMLRQNLAKIDCVPVCSIVSQANVKIENWSGR